MLGIRTDCYGYNNRNELISAGKLVGRDAPIAPQAPTSTVEYAYQYDDIGNRISSLDLGTNRTYVANSLNQYTMVGRDAPIAPQVEFEPQYDDDGNQTLIQTSTGIWQVQYNGENRPIFWSNGATNIVMQFDRMGRRVQYLETCNSITNSHKVFTYDGYLQIANSELIAQDSQLFIWDPTEPVATRPLVFWQPNAPPQYYTHDGNKNVSDITDATQSLSAHYSYTPFGSLLSSSGSSSPSNPFRFSSEFADDALGLVYYNYRHYNPEIGRWMRRDPLWGLLAGYCYCFNNTARFDFRGLYEKYSFEDSRVVKMQKNSNTFGAAKTFSVFKRMRGDKYERTVEKLSDEECETMKKQTSFFMARYSKSSNSRNIERVPCSKKCPCYRAIVRRPHITVKPILVFKGGEGYDENNPDDYTWVLENRVDDEVLLAHENIHWAITQKIAADATAKMRSLYGRALSCEANSAVIFAYDFLEEKIEKAMNEYGDLWSNLQNRFDRETEHGDDYNKEKEWEEDPQWR